MEVWKILFIVFAIIFFTGSFIFVLSSHKTIQEGIKLQKKMIKEVVDYWLKEKSGK